MAKVCSCHPIFGHSWPFSGFCFGRLLAIAVYHSIPVGIALNVLDERKQPKKTRADIFLFSFTYSPPPTRLLTRREENPFSRDCHPKQSYPSTPCAHSSSNTTHQHNIPELLVQASFPSPISQLRGAPSTATKNTHTYLQPAPISIMTHI